jgi:hypothetical protein
MAGRRARTKEPQVGRARDDERGYVGWGVEADPEDNIFLRRVVFAALIVVVASVGAWFLVTTLGHGYAARPVLSANGQSGGYAAALIVFPSSSRENAKLLVDEPRIQDLAGGRGLECVPLEDGRMAVCTGRFESDTAPELLALVESFRGFVDGDSRPFAAHARVIQRPR